MWHFLTPNGWQEEKSESISVQVGLKCVPTSTIEQQKKKNGNNSQKRKDYLEVQLEVQLELELLSMSSARFEDSRLLVKFFLL